MGDKMINRQATQIALIAAVAGLFYAVSHLIYYNLNQGWNNTQLQDLAARSVLRTELATDLAVKTVIDIQTRGLTACSKNTIAAYKKYVMSVGGIKDIRLRTERGNCAVFSSDSLEKDLASLGSWETGLNSTIQLAVLPQAEGVALSILWKGANHDIVAIFGTGGLLFDMAASDLRPHITMRVSLNSGKEISTYKPGGIARDLTENDNEQLRFSAYSKRYPIKAQLSISKTAFANWNKNCPPLMDLLIGLTGLLVGFLAARAALPPPGAIDEIDIAIEQGEFVPYFQPIIDLQSSQISGFEMLARWIKPDGELISPGSFIPLAENFGRIDAMLFSLLRVAGLSLAAELRANPDLKMTFNVTPAQFLDPTFLPRLLGVLKLVGLPLTSLVAEITERQELADLELASQTIAQYKEHGIRIAIDDAGTGHNGLSSIQKLDVGTLKLDKIFIDGIVDNQRSQQMIELLVNLARQYQMTVVAEGIEHPEQAAAALSMGITEAQGFYFSRPIPAKDLLSLLAEQRQPLVQNNAPQLRKKPSSKFSIAS